MVEGLRKTDIYNLNLELHFSKENKIITINNADAGFV